ncbi:M15 family metallopeptidase [Porcipelethomonas sp.]|uniref:M15 family metallopeptidase n=1 Tax=Porcipelethomonas sp. TaxID=2981675 RepID=UPI003EF9FD0F
MSTYRKRKSRVRYDRIIGVAAIFIVLIILLVSCCKSCGKDDNKNSGETSSIIPTENKNENPESEDSTSDESSVDSLENYSTVSALPNDVYKGDLILVNSDHEYTFPVSDEENTITPIYELMNDTYQINDYETSLSSVAINALNSMMEAFYAKTGNTDIMVVSGYRTKEYQDDIYNSGTSNIKGGYSEYHTGLSMDLGIFPENDSSYYYTAEEPYSWISENCANYGFILRYPEGKEDKTGVESKSYQFRYVGIPHAVYISQNDLCLEEYIDELKNHSFDGEHLKVNAAEKNYEIYYVAADPSANTDIPVPSDKTYTISGNNVDGFIVTVEL